MPTLLSTSGIESPDALTCMHMGRPGHMYLSFTHAVNASLGSRTAEAVRSQGQGLAATEQKFSTAVHCDSEELT